MKRLIILIVLSLIPVTGDGQTVELEARGGMSIGSHSTTFAALEVLPQPMGELLVKKSWRNLAFVIGGLYSGFGCAEGFCSGSRTMRIRHYSATAGLELREGIAWFRGMAGMGMSEIRGIRDRGPAANLAAGVRIPVGPLTVAPGVTYRWMQSESETIVLDAGLGFTYSIGGGR